MTERELFAKAFSTGSEDALLRHKLDAARNRWK